MPPAFETRYPPFNSATTPPVCFQGIGNDCIRPFITAGSEEDKVLTPHSNLAVEGTSNHEITSTTRTTQGILHIGGVKKLRILHLVQIKSSGRKAQGISDRVVIVGETNKIGPFEDRKAKFFPIAVLFTDSLKIISSLTIDGGFLEISLLLDSLAQSISLFDHSINEMSYTITRTLHNRIQQLVLNSFQSNFQPA